LAPINSKMIPLSLVLIGSVVLTACSSKPSPWAESSSPWNSRAQQVEEPVESEAAMSEEAAPVEVEMAVIEADTMPTDAAMEPSPMYDEPMPVMEETMPVVPEEPALPGPGTVMVGDLASQPSDYFVVQVVASSTMKQLTDFAQTNQISDEWVAETTVGGKTWYVLMLGVYPTKSEADQALSSVADLETQPWVRSVGSVQAVMN
jgi:DamX protein